MIRRREYRTTEEKKIIKEQVLLKKSLENRKKRLYNKIFRKSLFYNISLITRVLYITLFITILIFIDKSAGFKEELVLNKKIESETRRVGKFSTRKVGVLSFKTNKHSYSIDIENQFIGITNFNIGDTLLIEKNIFGRPIYFTKTNWRFKYGFGIRPGIYLIPLFISFLSLFFRDGYDRGTIEIIWIASILCAIGLLGYFLDLF